jgi:lipid II:glycine glycyltransferase (peptidoglycan interpeptide bridge formation enzyme)
LILNDNPAILNFLLKEYNNIIQKKAIYTQVRNLCKHGYCFQSCFELNGFRYEEHLDILLYIDRPENALWKNLHAKKRNKIRRARQEGTTFAELTTEERVNEAYNILAEVYGRARLPLGDPSLFTATFAGLYPKGLIRFFGAYNQNKLIGVLVALCYKDRIYDWYAGSYREYQNKFPNDLLPWEIFLWGKEKGYKIFDFGGAGKPGISYGVREHKKKFGGEMVCFGRYEKIHKPLLMKMGKLGFNLRRFLNFSHQGTKAPSYTKGNI